MLTSQLVEEIPVEGWVALILTPIGLAADEHVSIHRMTTDDDALHYRRLRKNAKKIKRSMSKDESDVISTVLLLCLVLQRELWRKRVRMVTHPYRMC